MGCLIFKAASWGEIAIPKMRAGDAALTPSRARPPVRAARCDRAPRQPHGHRAGGSHWNDVLVAAAPYGLTALHGSAGDVSVTDYSLNGGVSFCARAYGLAVNALRAVQIVTADGSLVRASGHENTDLFWAVRGGGGSFGIVVSLEIDLLPHADVFAGMLLWDASFTRAVSRAWAE